MDSDRQQTSTPRRTSIPLLGSARTWPLSHSITLDPPTGESNGLPDEKEVVNFLTSDFTILCPPYFSWQPLKSFFESQRSQNAAPSTSWRSISRCLFDRTISQSNMPTERWDETPVQRRATIGSERTLVSPSTGAEQATRKVVSALELSKQLDLLHDDQRCGRTVLFFTDISPLYGTVLAVKAEQQQALALRTFLQCHVAGEVEFCVVQLQHQPGHAIHLPRHINNSDVSHLEFHLSYVALRRADAGEDPRGLRAHITMIEPLNAPVGLVPSLVCYDAHISLLVYGKSDQDWRAYCCVDTWFGSEQPAELYVKNKEDGPSGGARLASEPCWNPREYFFLVLAQRFRQTSMEWGNVFTELMKRCDGYESHYLQNIDTADLYDDYAMSRTRSYSKAASMLRQFHDTLSDTLERLQIFLKETEPIFKDDQDDFEDQCGCYHKIIDFEYKHLDRWRRRLYQRMLRFDSMRDGLLNASVLAESRRSTKQGADIGMLTNVTIAYLPFSVAAGIFGISTEMPSSIIWLAWVGVSIALALATFYLAFGHRHAIGLLQKRNPREKL